MRNHYWNCGKIADLLRGTPKLDAGTAKEWREWNKKAKTLYPFRYWLVEDCIPSIQRRVYAPYDKIMDIKYWLLNRYVTKSHALTAGPKHIKPGQWQDLGDRILYCLFDELVNFVEIECAWRQVAFCSEEDSAKYNVPKWGVGILRTRTWRSARAGLDNLEWQADLKFDDEWLKDDSCYGQPTPQALAAQEILELYKWWTQVYPNRPEPMEESGWSDYCAEARQLTGCIFDTDDQSPRMKEKRETSYVRLQEIEEQYRREDEAMLIRLIKVRGSLWT
jgi:hypothetical protein